MAPFRVGSFHLEKHAMSFGFVQICVVVISLVVGGLSLVIGVKAGTPNTKFIVETAMTLKCIRLIYTNICIIKAHCLFHPKLRNLNEFIEINRICFSFFFLPKITTIIIQPMLHVDFARVLWSFCFFFFRLIACLLAGLLISICLFRKFAT